MTESEFSGESQHPELLDESYVNFSNEELQELLEDALNKNEKLKFENLMFDRYLKRIEKKHDLTDSEVQAETKTTEGTPASSRTNNRKRSKSRTSASERSLKLTAEQKCEIAQSEIEEYKQEIEKNKIESEKILDTYKAIMEEADIRLAEINKLRYEFDRDVVKGGINPITKIYMSEKFVRHFEERLKQRDTLIDKLRLKNSTLRQQKSKLKMQLKQKEEMGEVLHEVDFKQLKIENTQYLEKIEEKNQELMRLKLMAGRTLQVLNSYKKKLNTLMNDVKKIKSEIYARQELSDRIQTETIQVEQGKIKAELTNEKLRQQLSDYRVPAVMDYVNCVADQYELNKRERILTRKVDIAKMALDRHKKIWNQVRHANAASLT